MNYAQTDYIGNRKKSRSKQAKAVEPTAPRVYQVDEADEGCTGNQKGHKKIRPCNHAPNGFLKTTFLPKLKLEQPAQAREENENLERDFYTSLSLLSAHYGIVPLDVRQYSYPYNIMLSMYDIKARLINHVACFDGIEIQEEGNRYRLKTEERYNTGATLFYIPVLPIYMMLHDKQRKKTIQLLLSVCSYLYHVADIPYYRQEDSYLYWQYEMLKDWIEQDEECENKRSDIADIQMAEWIGDCIEQKIFNRKNLTKFRQRLKTFRPNDGFDEQCLKLSERTLSIYSDYPNENILRNSKPINKEEEDSDEGEIIPMDKYVSFWADNEGWLADNLQDCINNEFNEYGDVDEPTVSKIFDGSPIPLKDLDFECRLFKLLDDLIYLLNTYKKKRNGNLS